jgi:hypothetical protein
MMPPMPGAPPPPMGGAGTGAATAPGPMAGSAAHGMTSVKIGLEALQKALPQLPMGSELHSDVMKAISNISKHLSDQAGQGGGQIQQLMELMRAAKTGGGQPNMAAMMPGGGAAAGGAPPPPGGAPPPPPMPGAA